MFEQHPVPQQISSYQFRLVGDMTLKQFFQLAAGAVIGLIIYSLPMPSFLRWPLIVISVVAGAAFAFLPIQDRPLEQWLVAFFRSIYSPTIFVWRKHEASVQYFATDLQAASGGQQLAVAESLAEPEGLVHDVAAHNLDKNEENFLNRISVMLSGHKAPPAAPAQTQVVQAAAPQTASAPAQPSPTPLVTQPVIIPENKPVDVFVNKADTAPKAAPPAQKPATPNLTGQTVGQTLATHLAGANTQAAEFSPDAAPPTPPTQPNVIVGQVMDSAGKIVEGAILEINDTDGRPVRALKTNKAGHFLIVTPLPNGEYRVQTEKEGLTFPPVKLTLTGELVQPIAIKASQ